MVFITLGSQKFQFNRLLITIDELIDQGVITDEVYAQTGYSDYIPQRFRYQQFMDRQQYAEMEGKADVVITHGGTGAILGAVKNGKKVIAVPRLARYGEHVDDHQLQLLKVFDDAGIILVCYDLADLGKIYQSVDTVTLRPFVSNRDNMIKSIDQYLESL